MPRSFLLKRAVHTQDDAKAKSKGKIQNKGRKIGLLPKLAKRSYGSFESGRHPVQDDSPFWSGDDRKHDTDSLGLTSYTYQSYIDGDVIQKDNSDNVGIVGTEEGQGKVDKADGQLVPQILTRELNVERSDGMAKPHVQATGTKPVYRCEQCGKMFKTKYTLTIHLKMPNHTGARPFVCNICGKGFRLSSTLCRHKIIHTSDKPHQCHICQKAFNRSSTLKTHIRTHSEKKEFICDVCGKGFHQKGNLRNHFLIHTGEKPYRCRLCNKAFNKLSNLKFHLHIHTDNTPYRCRYCKTAFSRRCDLKQHIRTSHDQDISDYYEGEEP